jgi:hypothetical protein
MIVAALCTIPHRKESFRQVLNRILYEQTLAVDKVYVWLNGYNEVPGDLPCDPRVMTFLEPDNPGPWKRYELKGKVDAQDIVLTLDDDLIYPSNYVEIGVNALLQQDLSTSICFAGAFWDPVVPLHNMDFYMHRRWIPYNQELTTNTSVSVIMGGISIHRGSNIQDVVSDEIAGFRRNDDLMASLNLQRHNIKIVSIAKPQNWINEHPNQNAVHALWRTDRDSRAKTFQTMIQRLEFKPFSKSMHTVLQQPCQLIISTGELPESSVEKMKSALPDISLHTLEIITGGHIALTSRPLRNYMEHFVGIPNPGGRFEVLPGIRQWREWRVESYGWKVIKQYLEWLKAALNIQKTTLAPTIQEPDWLIVKLRDWIARFPAEKILSIV